MNNKIKIGKVVIGEGLPCVVIPEACDNHHGNLKEAKALAKAAKDAGAKIIKFQLHLPDEEMDRVGMAKTSSKMFKQWGDLYGFIKKNLLSVSDHAELIKYCKKIGIQYFCTPFSVRAAEILKEIGGDAAYKIGSGETEDLPMIEKIANMKKPMVISTGMTELEEIDESVKLIKNIGTPLVLAHCISSYPPKSEQELHLGVIRELRDRYGVPVGFSDHTPPDGIKSTNGDAISEREIIWGAISQKAVFIEKHFTLDRNSKDADSRFSHDSKTLKKLIDDVKMIERALDKNKVIYSHEKDVWIWAKRSLFAAVDIPKNTTIKREMIESKRPGIGIRSKFYKKVLGKKTKKDIKRGDMLTWKVLN